MALVARATSLALKCGSASKPRPSPVQITPLGSDVNARQQREHDASCESARALALIRAEILSRYCIGEREREVEKQTEGGAFWRDTSHFSKRKKKQKTLSQFLFSPSLSSATAAGSGHKSGRARAPWRFRFAHRQTWWLFLLLAARCAPSTAVFRLEAEVSCVCVRVFFPLRALL